MEENEIKIRLGMRHTPVALSVGRWRKSSGLRYIVHPGLHETLSQKKKDKMEKVSYFPTILASQNMNHFS